MSNHENEPPPERRRLNRARRTSRNLRGKPVLPKRRLQEIPSYERLPGRLLKGTMPRPANPKEAREWLRDLADFLSTYPHASRKFRFIAYAIKQFLNQKKPLSKALGLVTEDNARRGRPATPSDRVTRVVLMLREDPPKSVSIIAEEIGVSKDTVETIRAEMHKVTLAVPDSERAEDGDVRQFEWEQAQKKAAKVRPERRAAILAGIAANIDLSNWRDESAPQNLHTAQPVAPQYKPNRVRRKS